MTDHSANPWVCSTCGKEHTVPSLARACESLHDRQRLEPARRAPFPAEGPRAAVVPAASPGAEPPG